jgi:glycosyltransferase involved in cell wall biosynthesis
MCLGKIPVMFNLPYAREFTEDGKYAILCDDIQDMALKIKDLYCSSSASHFEMQIRSFARQNYNIDKTSMAYYELYKRVINNSARARASFYASARTGASKCPAKD